MFALPRRRYNRLHDHIPAIHWKIDTRHPSNIVRRKKKRNLGDIRRVAHPSKRMSGVDVSLSSLVVLQILRHSCAQEARA